MSPETAEQPEFTDSRQGDERSRVRNDWFGINQRSRLTCGVIQPRGPVRRVRT